MPYNVEPQALTELLGFAPDADPNTPGTFSDCTLVIPNHRGFQTPHMPATEAGMTTAGASVLSTAGFQVRDARWYEPGDRSSRFILAGEDTAGNFAVHAAGPFANVDISPAAITAFPGLVFADFAQFGDHMVMSRYSSAATVELTTYSGSGSFTAIPGSPAATYLTVAERFVLAFNTTTFNLGNVDSWACCARDDHTSWTANPATLATTGRLPDEHGGFTGAITLGALVYAFKNRTCYVGRFVGAPEVWQWVEWPYRLGAIAKPKHYKQSIAVLGELGLYLYNGASITPLMVGRVERAFVERAMTGATDIVVDEARDLIYVNIRLSDPLGASTLQTETWVCHVPTRKWGKATLPGVQRYIEGRQARDGEPYVTEAAFTIWAVPESDRIPRPMNRVYDPSDTTAQPSFTVNDFGDAFADVEVAGVDLKLITSGTASTCIPMHRDTLDAALTTGNPVPRDADGHYSIRANARWHRLKFDMGGPFEITGMRVTPEPRGSR